MLTIFSPPRPFRPPFDTIQYNAILSWMKLSPKCEIILFEDEEKTTSKVAEKLGLQCVTDVKCDEFGTPLLDDVFNKVQTRAGNEIISFVNSDIILMDDFLKGIEKIKELSKGKPFFMTGRRWDVEIKEPIQFEKTDWQEELKNKVAREGKLHGLSGMDCWIFPKFFKFNAPPFVIGRPGMDSWLIFKARSLKIPVVDETAVVTVVHQNHHYPHQKKDFFETQKRRNIELAGGLTSMCTLRDADWLLTEKGLERPAFPRRIFSLLTLFYPWRLILALKRKIQRFWKK